MLRHSRKTAESEVENRHRNFYGRIHGKTMSQEQKRLLREELPRYVIPGIQFRSDNNCNLEADLLGKPPYWLEIGFGGGEHLAHIAERHPEITMLGVEPFVNGVAMLLGKLKTSPMQNVKIYPGDVRDVFDAMPDKTLSRCYLLYPDPWPKTRHHRRRFVTQEYLTPLSRVMQSGAELRIATDISSYVDQALREIPKAGFELSSDPDSFSISWKGWNSTRYEQKALREGRPPHYLIFKRL